MRTKVEIINKTKYRKADLRKWTIAALRHRGALNARTNWYVEWSYGNASGQAYVRGSWFLIRIPSETPSESTRKWMIGTMLHEIDHCLGLRNEREMRAAKRHDLEGFIKGFPDLPWPRRQSPPKKAPRGKARPTETKLEEARRKVKEFTKKEKRATTFKKKWLAKVRYYEKRKQNGEGA